MSHSIPRRFALAATVTVIAASVSACSLLHLGGSTSALNMKVGQCVQIPEGTRISRLKTSECTAEHDGEVFYIEQFTDSEKPPITEMKERASTTCINAFDPYVGRRYEDSTLDIMWVLPTDETWSVGDRDIVCIAFSADGGKLTSSVKDSSM